MRNSLFLFALPVLLLNFASCKEKEDLTEAYRKEFSGNYTLESIYAPQLLGFDLNGDGETSANLLLEYNKMSSPCGQASLAFTAREDGGYSGMLSTLIPLQAINTDAQPPFSVETPVSFDFPGIIEYAFAINVNLDSKGNASWEPALQERDLTSSQIYTALLYDASVVDTRYSQIDVTIREVPVYDCIKKAFSLQTLTYHFVHK